MGDLGNIAANLLEDCFYVNLLVGMMRELDIKDSIKLPRSNPGNRSGVTSRILRMFNRKSIDSKTSLSIGIRLR